MRRLNRPPARSERFCSEGGRLGCGTPVAADYPEQLVTYVRSCATGLSGLFTLRSSGQNARAVHPPPFLPSHRLSDWPACSLELNCCKGKVIYPLRLLAQQHGNCSFADILARLRCGKCGSKPAPVYLCAGHRHQCGGAPPDWAIELVPEPKM